MFRRSFLGALSAVPSLPLIPDRVRQDQSPPVPSEDNFMFWFHFYGAIQRDRPMSTEWAREKTVEELDLQNLTDAEERLLRAEDINTVTVDDLHGIDPKLSATAITIGITLCWTSTMTNAEMRRRLVEVPGLESIERIG